MPAEAKRKKRGRPPAQPRPPSTSDLIKTALADQKLDDASRLQTTCEQIAKLYGEGQLRSVAPILPLLLKLKGKPYSLADHFPMEPVFATYRPRRLVLKCGRQLSKSTCLAALIPVFGYLFRHFHMLYVAPRFPQTEKFSKNYVNPFIRDTPLGNLLTAGEGMRTQSILQKNFAMTQCTAHFSYAFLDCDRTRGISADLTMFDECFVTGTGVLTPGGEKQVQELSSGEPIISFDQTCGITCDKVVRTVSKGLRHVWELRLSDGRTLQCTANERIRTSEGWVYVEQIINEAAARRFGYVPPTTNTLYPPDASRHTLGRWIDVIDGYKVRSLLHRARQQTGSVLPVRSVPAGGVCENTPAAGGEQGVREAELHFFHPHLPRVRILTAPVLRAGRADQKVFAELVSLRYVGKKDVWDVETEKHHTLFAGGVGVHNCQDLNIDFFDIIDEVLSASPYKFRLYAGTPKTLDGPLEKYWDLSNQCEWCIRCEGCNHWNICAAKQDLLKMIQKAGPSCSKCGKLLDPRTGLWVPGYPERDTEFWGLHQPQVIFPMHYAPNPITGDRESWAEIYKAANGGMETYKFWNEKLGESFDVRSVLLSRADIKNACVLVHENDLNQAIKRKKGYVQTVMGVDWGGGGISGISLTGISVLGFRHDGLVDVLFMDKLGETLDPLQEATLIMNLYRRFQCVILAHDAGGSGGVRETFLIQMGFNPNRLFPASYINTGPGKLVRYHPPEQTGSRHFYTVDKPRSLVLLCQLIKNGGVRFPKYDSWKRYSDDFLALVEDKRHVSRGADVYIIDRKRGMSDDLVHSVNFAALAYWHSHGKYPDIPTITGARLTDEQLARLHPVPKR